MKVEIFERGGVMEQAIEEIVNQIMVKAVDYQASDIHLLARKDDGFIRFRVDGQLVPYRDMEKETYQRLLSHFKFLAAMDIGEKRKPQGGALMMTVQQQKLQLRLSTLPSDTDESLVIRIHPQYKQVSLSKLSLFPKLSQKLTSFLHHSHGLFIFTGPVGTGKTTTLYSLLQEEIALQQNIITLEDPIEQRHDHMIQVQFNEKAGITFETGLKSILRHDPDIILIGEIRDAKTAKIAIQAALTGHTILATLHTRNTLGAIYRLLDLGVSLVDLEQVLKAVVSQRLVMTACPFCEGPCEIYCNRRKRLAIYEILQGKHLEVGFQEANGKMVTHTFPTLSNQLRKGYALGYLSAEDVERGRL